MNVLFITVDQWRGDCLSLAGHPCVRTPNVDALARDSTAFTRHFTQASPCSPARASLYTGLYLMNHRVCVNGTPLDTRHTNIANEARRAGYDPMLFGYTDQSIDPRTVEAGDPRLSTYEGVLPGFTQRSRMDTEALDWLEWLRGQGVETGESATELYATAPAARGTLNVAEHLTQRKFSAEQTETRFQTDRALEYINARKGKRWFAHVSYIRPHPPFSIPEPYASMIPPTSTPAPVRRGDVEQERAQHPFLGHLHGISRMRQFVTGQGDRSSSEWTADEVAAIRAVYYAMVMEVDAEIGRLIGELKATGAYDDTLIVLTSDHGEMLGDHFLFGKAGYFDQAFHIPLIIRAPGEGLARGETVTNFTEAVDVMPTMLDLLGLEVPTQTDGRPLTPFLQGERPERWRDASHWEFDFRDVVGAVPEEKFGIGLDDCQLAVLRDDTYKYVHFPGMAPILFDLDRDPEEFENRAGDPDYMETTLRYAQKMLSWRMRHADRTLSGSWIGEGGPVERRHADRI